MRPAIFDFTLALSLSVGLLGAAHASERTYRWIDAQGRVHYSDVKSEKGEPVEIRPGSRITNLPKHSPANAASQQLECQRRKDQLALYNSASDVSETDSLGNTRTYTAEERAKLIEKAQQQQQAACGQTGLDTDG